MKLTPRSCSFRVSILASTDPECRIESVRKKGEDQRNVKQREKEENIRKGVDEV
jgi:hypothetical protein